ncbi:MAG: purine-binding chemotaxis protein CheW [Deltaproteobacteria bacterium]|nr:purine-binding chemotaxis protein CheW [Deltaproteobacteria bacterium]
MDQTNCYCIFRMDDQLFGVAVARVEKIIRAAAVTPVPDSPETLTGLLNVEGRIFPVVNLRKKWRLPERAMEIDDRIILFKTDRIIGFVVNGVEGVVQFDHLGFHQAGDIQPGLEKYIEGAGKLDHRNVIIVDLARFLNSQELGYMEKITADHG